MSEWTDTKSASIREAISLGIVWKALYKKHIVRDCLDEIDRLRFELAAARARLSELEKQLNPQEEE